MSRLALLLLLAGLTGCATPPTRPVAVGSKKFTESVILGEMACHLIRDAGGKAIHREQLGGTQVLWQALLAGEIDLYPEYTGTLEKDIVKGAGPLEEFLAARGIRISRSLGFENSYGLGMKQALAEKLGIRDISDLAKHPQLRYGFSEEFHKRDDGWRPLQSRYGLNVAREQVTVLDHDLAYRGLEAGRLDVIDVYTTEGEIQDHGLVVLRDDRKFFPAYEAVWVYRADLAERLRQQDPGSRVLTTLLRLEGRINAVDMRAMNLEARNQPGSESRIAADFLRRSLGISAEAAEETLTDRLLTRTREHLFLVLLSLGAAILVAIPLGILAAQNRLLGQIVLAVSGVLQTIPSLALLVFLIPLLGIGAGSAIAALFLYSLLPIVRNTHAGLTQVPGTVRESAQALGLPPGAILRLVELPLASRSILAGIKTAAVINVGTATLGALIGAGGYGQPILSGIRLGNLPLILEGALPAAGLALAVQGLFEIAERWLTPNGLRLA